MKVDVELTRAYQDTCTIGMFVHKDFIVSSLELPWKDNSGDISCIYSGVYKCNWIESPSLGWCYELTDVFGRTYIRIHSGNFTYQIRGCILVGDTHKDIDYDGIPDVTNSVNTLNKIHSVLGDSFMLHIK